MDIRPALSRTFGDRHISVIIVWDDGGDWECNCFSCKLILARIACFAQSLAPSFAPLLHPNRTFFAQFSHNFRTIFAQHSPHFRCSMRSGAKLCERSDRKCDFDYEVGENNLVQNCAKECDNWACSLTSCCCFLLCISSSNELVKKY